jgi:hypothetical protein
MDINQAVQLVLRKALAHDGLSRGLHEATRAIEKVRQQACSDNRTVEEIHFSFTPKRRAVAPTVRMQPAC